MTTLPANVRINMPVPFPAQVVGTGVVKVSKSFGVWTVSLDFSQLTPAPIQNADLPNTYFYVWNAVTGVYNLVSLSFLQSPPTPNLVTTNSFNLPGSNYGDVLVDFNGAVAVQLPASASRNGIPVAVVDIGHFASLANAITITPNGSEKIMGLNNLSITTQDGSYVLYPSPLGGWYTK